MKVYDRMPIGLDCPIVGINVSDPSVVCTANIAPASPHHTLPIYRRFWSSVFPYDHPDWAAPVGPNPDWCATQYVLNVRPTIPGMALLLGDVSMDSIVSAALLKLQANGHTITHEGLGLAVEYIRTETGLSPWQRRSSTDVSHAVNCLVAACEAASAIDIKVEVAMDWLTGGIVGQHAEHLMAAGSQRAANMRRAVQLATIRLRGINTDDKGAETSPENLPKPIHFWMCLAYLSSGNLEELMRVGFDHAPVVIAATDRRYSIGVHPGAAVALDVPRLLDRLEQMEAAALAYEKPREAVMAYLAKQPTGWRMENHRITACSLLHSDEVMAAVWACMLGSKKLPAWRAGGQSVKTE